MTSRIGQATRGIWESDEELTALELAFESKVLRTICESESRASLELGAAVAESLKHRLADLRAARTAIDLLAGHPRTIGGREGECMVVDLRDDNRLVFAANHPTSPMTQANNLDWTKVTRIKILRIESDHG